MTGDDTVVRRAGATRNDVARLAGVSTAVVSYVVNGGPRPVSETTAARVRDAIDRLGYRPNTTARALAVGSTKTIGLVVPDSTNPFFAEYAWQIQRAATDLGYAVLITNTGFDPVVEERGVLDLCDRQIDGLLLAGASGLRRVGELSRGGRQMPVVLIDAQSPLHGYTTVGADAAAGTRRVVGSPDRHPPPRVGGHDHGRLRRSGHRRPGTRLDRGARSSRPSAGCGGSAPRSVVGVATRPDCACSTSKDRPSAVFVSADVQAIGLLHAARELGVSLPDELAVGSFDDSEESRFCWPPLTTAQQPTRAMAEAAVTAVLRGTPVSEHLVFDMPLVVRRSCGCPTG